MLINHYLYVHAQTPVQGSLLATQVVLLSVQQGCTMMSCAEDVGGDPTSGVTP